MFYLIGLMLDKTRVNFDEKERFSDLKKQYKNAISKVGLTFTLLIFLIVSGLFVWYKGQNPTPARFFLLPAETVNQPQSTTQPAQRADAPKIQELRTSLSPRMSAPRVQSWLKHSLIELHSMNFLNYNEVLRQSEVVFREDTYDTYLLQMRKKGGLVSEVTDKSLVMSLTPLSEVRVLARGSTGTRRVWKMQMIGLVVRTGSIEGGSIAERRRFDVLVEEVPTTQNPYGLVIAQYSSALAPQS